MDGWQITSTIAAILQTIAVIISLYFIWRQVEQQTKQITQQTDLARIANVQSLVGLSSPYNLELIKDPDMARFWVEGVDKFETYDEVDKSRYKALLIWWLILHENVFYQKQKGLLDEDIYATWLHDLEYFVRKHNLEKHWPNLEASFQFKFRKHVEDLIKKVKLINENEADPDSSSETLSEAVRQRVKE